MAQIRQEINIVTAGSASVDTGGASKGASTSADGNVYVQLDTTQYNGTVTYYFEWIGNVASGTSSVKLRRKGTSTDDATLSVTGSTTAVWRSTAFTPPAGQTEYMLRIEAGTGDCRGKAARIIIIQNSTKLDRFVFIRFSHFRFGEVPEFTIRCISSG